MRRISFFLVVSVALVTLGACASSSPTAVSIDSDAPPAIVQVAEQDPVQRAEALAAANVAATGGHDNWEKVNTVTMKAEVATMGMQLPLTIWSKRPASMRSEVEVAAMNATIISAYDGSTAWMSNPMMGPEPVVLPEEQAKSMAQGASIDGVFGRYKSAGYSLRWDGETEVDGTTVHKIHVERPDAGPLTVYLDAQTHLITMQEEEGVDPQSGEIVTVARRFSDYRAVGDVRLPFGMLIEMGSTQQQITIHSIDLNQPIENRVFALPVSTN